MNGFPSGLFEILSAGVTVTDGYFVYEVLADTRDGWLTVRMRVTNYVSRIPKSAVRLGS